MEHEVIGRYLHKWSWKQKDKEDAEFRIDIRNVVAIDGLNIIGNSGMYVIPQNDKVLPELKKVWEEHHENLYPKK